MPTTLGGVTLAAPALDRDGYEMEAVDVGAFHELASGGVIYDDITTRYRFTLRWNGITAAERTAIRTRYLVKTSQVFSPPDAADTYTVFVMPNSWRESYLDTPAGAGSERYFCELQLIEAA